MAAVPCRPAFWARKLSAVPRDGPCPHCRLSQVSVITQEPWPEGWLLEGVGLFRRSVFRWDCHKGHTLFCTGRISGLPFLGCLCRNLIIRGGLLRGLRLSANGCIRVLISPEPASLCHCGPRFPDRFIASSWPPPIMVSVGLVRRVGVLRWGPGIPIPALACGGGRRAVVRKSALACREVPGLHLIPSLRLGALACLVLLPGPPPGVLCCRRPSRSGLVSVPCLPGCIVLVRGWG